MYKNEMKFHMLMFMNAWMMLVLLKYRCQMQCLTLECCTHSGWRRYGSLSGETEAMPKGSGEIEPVPSGSGETGLVPEGSGKMGPMPSGSDETEPALKGSGEIGPAPSVSGETKLALSWLGETLNTSWTIWAN